MCAVPREPTPMIASRTRSLAPAQACVAAAAEAETRKWRRFILSTLHRDACARARHAMFALRYLWLTSRRHACVDFFRGEADNV